MCFTIVSIEDENCAALLSACPAADSGHRRPENKALEAGWQAAMSFAEGEEGGKDREWEEGREVDMDELPSTVSCSPATVSVLHGEAGVAAIGDAGAAAVEGDAVHCFFRLQDCWSCDTDLRVGSRVQINARLCPPGSRVS